MTTVHAVCRCGAGAVVVLVVVVLAWWIRDHDGRDVSRAVSPTRYLESLKPSVRSSRSTRVPVSCQAVCTSNLNSNDCVY